jgi:hypothetical protein
MSHGFPCQDCLVPALRQLALVQTLRGWLDAQGKLRGLHRRPRPIRVAIFDVARPFALAIAALRPVHTATRGGRVPSRGKAADRTRFQRDRLRQDRPNALHREQLLVGRRVVEALMDRLFQGFALLPETVQHHQATGDREHLGLISSQGCEVLLRQLVKPFAAEACPRIPCQNGLHTKDVGGVLTDQGGTFT